MSNNNLQSSLYIKVNGKQFEYKPYYIPLFGDKYKPKWTEYIPKPEDFVNAIGIAINVSKTIDFVGIDIDVKNLPNDIRLKINDYISELRRLYPDIYIEKTANNGFHIIVNMKSADIYKIVNEYRINKRLVANEVELFTPFDKRLFVIAPSKIKDNNGNIKQYETINGDIENLITLSYKELTAIIEDIRNIVEMPIVKVKSRKTETKTETETKINLSPELEKKANVLHRYLEKNPLYIEQILNMLGIEWKTNEYGYIINDLYGTGYIANIYHDSAVYKDFRKINVKRFSVVLAELYPEIVNELTEKLDIKPKPKTDNIRKTFEKMTTELDEIRINIDIGKTLLIAQTGSGKTKFIKEQVLKRKKKVIVLVPLAVQVAQEEQVYKREKWPIKAAFLYMDSKTTDVKGADLIFATYNQIEKIRKQLKDKTNEYILVIDEAHELILALRYRHKELQQIWEWLNKREQYLLMTATNYNLYLERFVNHVYKLKSHKKQNRYYTFVEVKQNKNKKTEALITNVIKLYRQEPNAYQLIYIDNKNELFKLRRILIENGIDADDIAIITADNKTDAKTIIEEYRLEKKITLTTRVLSAGFHLFTEGTVYYHIIPSEPNIMVQELNRVREYVNDKPLNNIVYAIIYIKPYRRKRKITVDHWAKDYMRLLVFEENVKRLLNKYKKQNPKMISHLTDKAYYNLLFHDAWKHLIIHDKYNRYYINSKELLSEILENEGFQYVHIELGNNNMNIEHTDTGTIEGEDLWDIFNVFRNYVKHMSIGEAKEVLSTLKGIEKSLFKLALRIKLYDHVIDDKYEQKLENWIKQKKIRSAHDSLTKLIDKYAIENLDKISGKDRAVIEAKFKNAFEELKTILNETQIQYNKDDIYNIKVMYKINDRHWNAILKRIGLKYNDKIRKYVVVDKKRLLRFLDKEQEYITVYDALKQVLTVDKTTYSKEELYKIKEEFGISKHKWSNLLKEIGLKYRATKKQYRIVDMNKFKVFLENNEVEIETETETEIVTDLTDYEIFEVNKPIPINQLRDKIIDLRRKTKKKVLLRFNDTRYLVQLLSRYRKRVIDSLADKVEYPELTNNIQVDTFNLGLTVDEVLLLRSRLTG